MIGFTFPVGKMHGLPSFLLNSTKFDEIPVGAGIYDESEIFNDFMKIFVREPRCKVFKPTEKSKVGP